MFLGRIGYFGVEGSFITEYFKPSRNLLNCSFKRYTMFSGELASFVFYKFQKLFNQKEIEIRKGKIVKLCPYDL